MNPIDMSAEERKQEQTRLIGQVQTAKATAKKVKEELTACKAAQKAAKTAEEKAAATEVCKDAEQKAKDATAKVAETIAEENAFRDAVAELESKATQAESGEAPKPAEPRKAAADPFLTLAKQYAKHYPACKAFHITSDKQVFLENDKSLALFHQRTLGGGEVQTIKIQ